MKKKILLLFLILLLPCIVHAEVTFVRRPGNYREIDCMNDSRMVGKSVRYENGMYYLENTTNSYSLGSWDDNTVNKVYICDETNQTECESVKAIYKDYSCQTSSGYSGRTSYLLRNGETDVTHFYVGTKYKYENGMYTMTEYEEHNISELTHTSNLSSRFKGYYFCSNYGISCQVLYQITDAASNLASQTYSSFVNLEQYVLVSNHFTKKDGQYYLINPTKAFLTEDGGTTGYTCRTHEDHCDSLYRIDIDEEYDGHDGREITYNLLNIDNNAIEKELKISDSFDITTFFTSEEINHAFSTKPAIADIKNGKLVLYRVGQTDIIFENDTTYKVIHLTVTQEALSGNPKTNSSSAFAVLLGSLLITALVIEKRKDKNE